MAKIEFTRENKIFSVNSGANLRQIARREGVPIYKGINRYLNCHGLGLCGTCAVELEASSAEAISPMTRGEEKLLKKDGRDLTKCRLACQCSVHGDVKVKTLSGS